ncbi:MAG: nicotinate (nicotinamide) nucleotide adenylyltransferase [Treponema sp.]|nr:nicotinate (nicotinamide) nucleotide adenylyltransferase [Treponema sp.]
MRIAVLGGSFNPIHVGHLVLADEVCSVLGYDRVLFVPAFVPPHKELNGGYSAKDRLEMTRLACADDERFEAESCEIDRGGVSYTYDTICYLEEKYSGQLEGKIGLIMGHDLLPGFHLWHRAKELSEKCELILALRPEGHVDSEKSNKPKEGYAELDADFDISREELFKNAVSLKNPLLDISSTEIRTRISEGRTIRYLVPSSVFKYIRNMVEDNK